MSPIKGHKTNRGAARGFTLVELMIAMSLSAVVFAAILSAYVFIGRNLARLVNFQQQESQCRRILTTLAKDVGMAMRVTTASDTQLTLTVPTASSPATVVYNYGNGRLTRTDSTGTTTLLTGVTAFDFNYYNRTGAASTSPLSIKLVELSYTSMVGNSANGTQARYAMVSPRLVLRNTPLLQ
jgi:prepilin-type N-terminal cleavage/methylation domain-containing protein